MYKMTPKPARHTKRPMVGKARFSTDQAEMRLTGEREDERGRLEDQVFRLLSAKDVPIREMRRERENLEEVFLESTRDA